MFLRNWARLYHKLTEAEMCAERLICLLGKRYRAQHPFFGKHRIVDFALLDDKILIEVDGRSHELPVQRRKDLVNDIIAEKEGWATLRFSNATVLDWVPGVTDIANVLNVGLNHRPTLAELEKALQDLDRAHPELASMPRRRKRAPGPKKVRRSGRKVDSK